MSRMSRRVEERADYKLVLLLWDQSLNVKHTDVHTISYLGKGGGGNETVRIRKETNTKTFIFLEQMSEMCINEDTFIFIRVCY